MQHNIAKKHILKLISKFISFCFIIKQATLMAKCIFCKTRKKLTKSQKCFKE